MMGLWGGERRSGFFYKRARKLRKTHMRMQQNRCAICGVWMRPPEEEHPESLTLDHIVPLSKGGSHCIDNTQAVCRSCNQWKNTTQDDERQAVEMGISRRRVA